MAVGSFFGNKTKFFLRKFIFTLMLRGERSKEREKEREREMREREGRVACERK